jgi:hypothetical protein
MGKKPDYKKKILQCLSENPLGLTPFHVSQKLEFSRNTVKKYIEELEAEELVYKKKLGPYTLYFKTEQTLLNKDVIISFIKPLIAHLKKAFPKREALFQELGRNIADSIIIPFSTNARNELEKLENSSDIAILESINKFLPYFNFIYDRIIISKTDINKKEQRAILRFVNSDMLEKSEDYIYYFYILAGIVEKTLSSYTHKQIKCEVVNYETFERREKNYIEIAFEFQIKLPEMEIEEIEDVIIPDSDIIDVDLIKSYLGVLTLTYIIRGCLLKKKILILNDKDFLRNHLLNFLRFIFENSFEIDISIESSDDYEKNKYFFKNFIVIRDDKVIGEKNKIFNPKNIRVERIFIQKFFAEYSLKTSLTLLRTDIQKAYILAKELSEKISELVKIEGKEKIAAKNIMDDLTTLSDIKISIPYFMFLMDIVENYFEVSIPEVWKFFLAR